ncbi:MAG: heparan-alpha-glucosaminide N-acetyltransferase domain-containing protein [Lewinella sp.]
MVQQERIISVDLLRGLTIAAMILVNNPGTWNDVYPPLLHAPWHGYTPTDLIFPFFLFLVGCSIAFAYQDRQLDWGTYRKILIRSGKLIALGLFLGAFTLYPPFVKTWSEIRFPGVLQRIGVVFLLAAPLALHLRTAALIGLSVILLLGYWGLMGFVPVEGVLPTYERDPFNWAMYIDKAVLGSHTWQEDYDPEGILSTLPAVVSCLIGVVTGRLLIGPRGDKVKRMLLAGTGLLVLGHAWAFVFPINKALWTSPFVLVTGGWAVILLAAIYYTTDVRKTVWGRVFIFAGANALILYFFSSFFAKIFGSISVGDTSLHGYLYDQLFVHDFLPAKLSSLLYASVLVLFYLALGVFLYRKRIFFRV